MSEPQIDKETYRKIKKMSREELNDFLIRYGNNLTKDSTNDLREMQEGLLQISGIGQKRIEQIIFRKKSFVGILIAFLIISHLSCVFGSMAGELTAASFLDALRKYTERGFMLLLMSIPIFLAVYSDEVSSHSMQCIVGRGVSRSKILWAKLIDCVLLTIFIFTAFMLLQYMLIGGFGFSQSQKKVYAAYGLICVLKIIAAASFSMMVLFITNSTPLGVFCMILFTTISPNVFRILYLQGIKAMNYSYDMILLRSMDKLAAGAAAWELIPWSVVYIFGAWLITYLFFRRKEFEF